MSKRSKKKGPPFENIWNSRTRKLILLIQKGQLPTNEPGQYSCKIKYNKKRNLTTRLNNAKTQLPEWNEIIHFELLDDSSSVGIEVYSKKLGSKKWVGSCTLGDATNFVEEMPVQKWYALSNTKTKEKEKDKQKDSQPKSPSPTVSPDDIDGSQNLLLVTYFYSTSKESKTKIELTKRGYEVFPKDEYKYYYYDLAQYFNTGDCLLLSGVGLIPTLLSVTQETILFPTSKKASSHLFTSKQNSQTPSHNFTNVGIILRIPNLSIGVDELYIFILSRNLENQVDSFRESKGVIGVNLFRLYEFIHRFSGSSLYWLPLNPQLSPEAEKKLLSFVFYSHKKKTLPDCIPNLAQGWSTGGGSFGDDLLMNFFQKRSRTSKPEFGKVSVRTPSETRNKISSSSIPTSQPDKQVLSPKPITNLKSSLPTPRSPKLVGDFPTNTSTANMTLSPGELTPTTPDLANKDSPNDPWKDVVIKTGFEVVERFSVELIFNCFIAAGKSYIENRTSEELEERRAKRSSVKASKDAGHRGLRSVDALLQQGWHDEPVLIKVKTKLENTNGFYCYRNPTTQERDHMGGKRGNMALRDSLRDSYASSNSTEKNGSSSNVDNPQNMGGMMFVPVINNVNGQQNMVWVPMMNMSQGAPGFQFVPNEAIHNVTGKDKQIV